MLALGEFEQSPFFSEKEKAAVAFAVELTANNRRMRPQVKARLKAHLSDAEIVDLTLACCWYNFMNRFNDGLEIDIDTEVPEALLDLMHATPAPDELAAAIAREGRKEENDERIIR